MRDVIETMTQARQAMSSLPDVVEAEVYRQLWPDLNALTPDELIRHFALYGETEGRQANRVATREDFVGLIPPAADVLEIGPFFSPLCAGLFIYTPG